MLQDDCAVVAHNLSKIPLGVVIVVTRSRNFLPALCV